VRYDTSVMIWHELIPTVLVGALGTFVLFNLPPGNGAYMGNDTELLDYKEGKPGCVALAEAPWSP
jgi:hypothetical protein